MKSLFSVTLFSLLALGCASKSVDKNKIASMDNIGVVAIFDDQLPVRYIGTTILNNKDFAADISKWSISQTLVKDVRSEFERMNKKTFSVKLDEKKVRDAKIQAQSLKDFYLGNRYQELQQYILAQAEQQGAQFVFIMHPMSHDNFPQYKPGFGLLCRSPFTTQGDLEIYSLIKAEIWNVKTKAVETSAIITPAEALIKTGKTCQDSQQIAPDKLTSMYKEQVMGIVKRSVDILLSRTL